MWRIRLSATAVVVICTLAWVAQCFAQQATITTPMQGLNDGFFESTGVGFGLSGRNWFFNNGGGVNAAAPAFGGFDPNAGAMAGFGFRFPGGNGFLNFGAAQGSSRSISSVAPSVTVMNGAQGFFADVTLQPFVVGVVPVVGGLAGPGIVSGPYPTSMADIVGGNSGPGPTMLEERLARIRENGGFKFGGGSSSAGGMLPIHNDPLAADDPAATKFAAAKQSTAGTPANSIAEIRRQQAAGDAQSQAEAKQLFQQGQAAQAAGKLQAARIFYRQAAQRASGKLLEEIQQSVHALDAMPGSFSSGG